LKQDSRNVKITPLIYELTFVFIFQHRESVNETYGESISPTKHRHLHQRDLVNSFTSTLNLDVNLNL